jgi:hypothetical protein
MQKEDYARIKVEIVDKKSREVIEAIYGEIVCIECLKKRYKDRNKIRVYV